MSRIQRRNEAQPSNPTMPEVGTNAARAFEAPPATKQEAPQAAASAAPKVEPSTESKAPKAAALGMAAASKFSAKQAKAVVIVVSAIALSAAGFFGYQQFEAHQEKQRAEEIRLAMEEQRKQEAAQRAEQDRLKAIEIARLAEEKAKADELARIEAERQAQLAKEAEMKLAVEKAKAREALARKQAANKPASTSPSAKTASTNQAPVRGSTPGGVTSTPPRARQVEPQAEKPVETAQKPEGEQAPEPSGVDLKKAIPAAAAILGVGVGIIKLLKKD